MKKLILPFFALFSYASNAQFSIVPQLGMDMFKTTIAVGDFSSLSPMVQQVSPSLSVRMAYKLKSGQGAFLGVATNSPAARFSFTDPQNAQTLYTTSTGNLNLRLEAGYQFTSKQITLRQPVYTKSYVPAFSDRSSGARSGCSRNRCSGMRSSGGRYAPSLVKTTLKDKGLFMSIKPSVGLALAPMGSEVSTLKNASQTTYEYRAAWNTALIAGTTFEFGTRNQPQFTVSINYLHSLGNNAQTLVNDQALKATTTTFSSKTSGFNISLGVPISFSKKKMFVQAPPPPSVAPFHQNRCSRYRTFQL